MPISPCLPRVRVCACLFHFACHWCDSAHAHFTLPAIGEILRMPISLCLPLIRWYKNFKLQPFRYSTLRTSACIFFAYANQLSFACWYLSGSLVCRPTRIISKRAEENKIPPNPLFLFYIFYTSLLL